MVQARCKDLIKGHGREAARHMKVFDISEEKYRRLWKETARRLGVAEPGPPHSARHTGASRDAATGYRTLAQIQRRGRWTSERSVLRYAKTANCVASYQQVPDAILEEGAALSRSRTRPAVAKD